MALLSTSYFEVAHLSSCFYYWEYHKGSGKHEHGRNWLCNLHFFLLPMETIHINPKITGIDTPTPTSQIMRVDR